MSPYLAHAASDPHQTLDMPASQSGGAYPFSTRGTSQAPATEADGGVMGAGQEA